MWLLFPRSHFSWCCPHLALFHHWELFVCFTASPPPHTDVLAWCSDLFVWFSEGCSIFSTAFSWPASSMSLPCTSTFTTWEFCSESVYMIFWIAIYFLAGEQYWSHPVIHKGNGQGQGDGEAGTPWQTDEGDWRGSHSQTVIPHVTSSKLRSLGGWYFKHFIHSSVPQTESGINMLSSILAERWAFSLSSLETHKCVLGMKELETRRWKFQLLYGLLLVVVTVPSFIDISCWVRD